ncbi:MAG: RNA polymerase sigma factor [Planctomycetota bacterium]
MSEDDRASADEANDAARLPFTEGDPAALQRLVLEHEGALRAFVGRQLPARLATKESISDLSQSIIGDVLPKVGDASFENLSAFRGWLYTVALNKIRERGRYWTADRRDQDRETPLHDIETGEVSARDTRPSEAARREERSAILADALQRLPEDQRTAVVLVRMQGESHEVAAQVLGRSVGACRNLLTRGLRRLSAILPDERPDESPGT